MTSKHDIFHSDFQVKPFWWEAYQPGDFELNDIPKETTVAIIGAGYTGLAAALELHKLGFDCCVFEADEPGSGASTLSGGLITASIGIKVPLLKSDYSAETFAAMIKAANDGISLVEQLIFREQIDCQWQKTGLLKLANTKKHFLAMQKKAELLNQHQGNTTTLIAEQQLGNEIGSTFYRGGILTQQAAHLQPALYYQGLLQACEKRQVPICKHAEVTRLKKAKNGWAIIAKRGQLKAQHVVVATNGYTGGVTPQFERRIIPLKPYIIATEILTDDLAQSVSPNNLSFVESRRISPFFRLSGPPGQQRMIFGSRVKWKDIEPDEMAPFLYQLIVDRYPQLKGTKITHAWTGNVALTLDEQLHMGKLDGLYYALGCNGSGVANMTYLGTQVARKIAGSEDYKCIYDDRNFPDSHFYNGRQRWFIPLIGKYLQLRDWLDTKFDV